MLRQTLLKALERRVSKPVMTKARGIPGRARLGPPAATLVAAGEPLYTGEELELPLDTTVPAREERVARRLPPSSPPLAAAASPSRGRSVLENRSQLHHHRPVPANARVLSRPLPPLPPRRRAPVAAEEDMDDAFDSEGADHVDRETAVGEGEEEEGAAVDEANDEHPAVDEAVEGESHAQVGEPARPGSGPSAPSTQQSKEAYRFLLDHIDAEIAALQRRHTAVTTRRQSLEERNSLRIKELFEFMESPWMLLTAEVQPPLPSTGVDVYLKEQRLKKSATTSGNGNGGSSANPPDAHDKMFVLACHKNYRGLPSAEKRLYEEAANFNAAVRQELKYRLATGCSRFEAFCQQVKECTADMVRLGRVPELPAAWHHANHHSNASGSASHYQGLSKWQRSARQAQAAAASSAEREGEARNGAAPRRPARAGARIKAAAAGSRRDRKQLAGEEEEPDDEGEEEGHSSASAAAKGKGRRGVGRGRPTAKRVAAAAKGRKDARRPRPAASNRNGVRRAKKANNARAGGAGGSSPRRSASIPLPDLGKLAIKKIRKVAAAAGSGRGTTTEKRRAKRAANASRPATKRAAAGGRRDGKKKKK